MDHTKYVNYPLLHLHWVCVDEVHTYVVHLLLHLYDTYHEVYRYACVHVYLPLSSLHGVALFCWNLVG